VPREHAVERVEDAFRDGAEQARRRAREMHRPEQRDRAPPVPDERPVSEHEMPTREALVLAERGEKRSRSLVVHRQKRELLSAVEEDDDPRRPAAEPSTPVVEEHRTTRHHGKRHRVPSYG
jgi:hypothetical protein